ncbi:MAG: helix-turn-helix transcriptional regulator [Candidatus Berkelbacteria bacterium]
MTNKLKVLRAEKNITQAELATSVGVTRSTINYLEKNEYMPSLPLAFRLASFFGKKIEEIFIYKEKHDGK